MKTIFETFKKSIYNPAFYKDAAGASFQVILKYYLKFALVLSVVMTVVLGIFLIPQGIIFVKDRAPSLVKEYYPKELSVHIEKGIASANVTMPYFVPLRGMAVATTSPIQNMLVIDTTQGFDQNKFEGYKTYALLTSTDLVTKDANGAITIQPLRGVPTTTIDQDVLLSWVANIKNSLAWIAVVGLVATFIIVFSGYVMYLVPLLLFALVPKLIAYIKKNPLSYASAYKMSMYAILPALALKTLLNLAGIFFLPAYFTLLVFMLAISINMRDEQEPTLFENNN